MYCVAGLGSLVAPSTAPELPVSAQPQPSAVTRVVSRMRCVLRNSEGRPASSAIIIVFDRPSVIWAIRVSWVECMALGQRFSLCLIGPGVAETLTSDKHEMGGMGKPETMYRLARTPLKAM